MKKLFIIIILLFSVSNTYAFFNKFKKEKKAAAPIEQKKPETTPKDSTRLVAARVSAAPPNIVPPIEQPADKVVETDENLELKIDSSNDDFESFENFMNTTLETPIRFDTTLLSSEEFDYTLSQLLNSWVGKQMNSSDCISASSSLPIPDSLYISRLSSLPHLIEMPYNNTIRSFIDFYAIKNRPHLQKMLSMSNYYFPIFEQALAANDLPLELKYLPVIESALNTRAISRAGAAGLWQFMISTGRLYGLEINSLIDERMDPIKSTKAAVRFLKDLYSIYGDWNLAIAAYNCGPGNVNKAIRRSEGKRDFWKIYPHLPRETRGYVPVFVAANYIMNYHKEHNICPANIDINLLTDTIMVSKRIHLEQVAHVLNLPIDLLRLLNSQYRRDIIPGDIKPYALCLPLHQIGNFVDRYDAILAYKADDLIHNRRKEIENLRTNTPQNRGKGNYTHTVVRGETLSSIAKKHRVSVKNLQNWNNIKGTRIRAGQRLKIHK